MWMRRKRREDLLRNFDSTADTPRQAYLLRKAVHSVNLQIRRNRKRKTDKGVRRKTQRWGRGKAGKGWTADDLDLEYDLHCDFGNASTKQQHGRGSDTPVLLSSARGSRENIRKGLASFVSRSSSQVASQRSLGLEPSSNAE